MAHMDVVLQRRLARRATQQLGLITRTQLVGLGFSTGQIPRLVRSGRLNQRAPGVFLVAGAPDGPAIDLAAACLSTTGVASHRSAAHLLGLLDSPPSRPEVTVGPTQSVRNRAILHRSSDLLRGDVIRVGGIRITNATRTLVDLGAVVPAFTLEAAFERALHAGLTTFDRVVRRFFQVARSGRPGVGTLRPLLIGRDPTLEPAASDLESLLLRILRDRGLPTPVRQFEVFLGERQCFVDVAYPDLKILIEGDGFGVHTTREAFETDRDRQNLLVLAGWLVLRFTWRQLCRQPDRVAAIVSNAHAQRSRQLS
jgi:very-short-patch-repair endonuclease